MYKKLIDTKIIRTRHEVSFHNGVTALSVIQDLQEVPRSARLVEVDEEGYSLTFEIEQEEVERVK